MSISALTFEFRLLLCQQFEKGNLLKSLMFFNTFNYFVKNNFVDFLKVRGKILAIKCVKYFY